MFDSFTVLAPAKINLGLKVFQSDFPGKERTDGFHSIESVFSTIPLFDEITVSVVPGSEGSCTVECVPDSGIQVKLDPVNNTFYNAYKAFCVLTGVRENVHVKVNKHIPAGGGLGGGSSDASSFLKSIDTIFSTHLNRENFLEISALVGSDVFFFTEALLNQGPIKQSADFRYFCAFVEGRGEIVRPFEGKTELEKSLECNDKILLVLPGVSVSTKTAYGLVDKAKNLSILHNSNDAKLEDCWKSVLADLSSDLCSDSRSDLCSKNQKKLNWKQVRDFCENDFTAPITAEYPAIKNALEAIKATGADFADMSGSGATLYGIFCNETKRVQAASILGKKYPVVLL